MKPIVAIDPGLAGAIALFKAVDGKYVLVGTKTIPHTRKLVKPARMKYKYTDPRKVIKQGKNKGQRPTVIRTPAKYKNIFDTCAWNQIIGKMPRDAHWFLEDTYVEQANYAKATYTNQGILQGLILAYSGSIPELVLPSVWKRKMELTKDKQQSLLRANKLHPYAYKSHDCAEAVLIGVYAYKFLL